MSQHKWLGMILLFSLLSSKKEGVFSLLQVLRLIKSNRRKTFRIIENSKRQFISAQFPFFQRVLENSFCMLYVGIPYLLVYNVHPNIMHTHFSRQFSNNILKYTCWPPTVKQTLWDRKNHQQIPQHKCLLTN